MPATCCLKEGTLTTRDIVSADLCDRIDALIEERSLLKHPFYTKWQAGELAGLFCYADRIWSMTAVTVFCGDS